MVRGREKGREVEGEREGGRVNRCAEAKKGAEKCGVNGGDYLPEFALSRASVPDSSISTSPPPSPPA